MYLLDTNVVIRYLNGRSPRVIQRWNQTTPANLFLCSIVKSELFHGAYKSTYVLENLRTLGELFPTLASVGFTDECAPIYGQLIAQLEKSGRVIGPLDLQIAAIALANNLTLITANTSEFGRIPGLRLENWEV